MNKQPERGKDNFDFKPKDKRAERAKRKKLVRILVTLGVMLGLLIIVVVALISYSLGAKSEKEEISSSESSNSSSQLADDEIPESAGTYQSQDMVGEGQIPDHYRGSNSPKATVIIYADYGCSHCQELAKNIDPVYDKYGDKVRFILRYFNVNFTNSEVMAKLVNAIYKVGGEDAFWKASDKLFADSSFNSALTSTELENKVKSYGVDLGLNGQAVLDAYNDSANNGIQAKIDRDQKFASDSGVQGTPSIFIGRHLLNSGSADDIASELDQILKQK